MSQVPGITSTKGYVQHDAVPLVPFDAMTVAEQVAHLMDDHSYGDDPWGDCASPEQVASWTPASRAALHDVDHIEDSEDGVARTAQDEDTATANLHRHYRSAAAFARAIVQVAETHDAYASDPGGWAAYIQDDDLDGPDPDAVDVVARAAFALLEHDAAWLVR